MEVEPDDLVERAGIELEERPLADRRGGDVAAGGVDEDVDAAPTFEHRLPGAFELRSVQHVGLEDDRGIAEITCELLERVAPSCEETDLRTGGSKASR